ncbi:hypothetical protein TRSC58_07333 [Trypanosoma rangeli SC58]|uniref:Uncharacterized protein n=1 Tax=Trypanosoma rangeli SC58 TaxID=429131 RepID=A0A061IT37_TRYRA|nr:hypothetical protein TRSC58_07333 [Trypanosoma rangeli SC58]
MRWCFLLLQRHVDALVVFFVFFLVFLLPTRKPWLTVSFAPHWFGGLCGFLKKSCLSFYFPFFVFFFLPSLRLFLCVCVCGGSHGQG